MNRNIYGGVAVGAPGSEARKQADMKDRLAEAEHLLNLAATALNKHFPNETPEIALYIRIEEFLNQKE